MIVSKIFKLHIRLLSKISTRTIILEPLKTRTLIGVKGNDSQEFLQGLITNDIYHLGKTTSGSMYAMFLNTKGRVLYDAIIYKIANDTFFIECDTEIEKSLERHLSIYKVRRKLDISSLFGEYQIHVLFNNIKDVNELLDRNNSENTMSKYDNFNILPPASSVVTFHKDSMIFKDPRVSELGYRIITRSEVNVQQEINDILNISLSDSANYKNLRYSLGIGEGVNDLPVGNCFPLECNCDYLHGLSFHKGCYIGQELTARTHHTGVVRKRLMPLYFQKEPCHLPNDGVINVENTKLGKLRGISCNLGLALLRINQALELGEFKIGSEKAKVFRPHWWPVSLPKEKIVTQKT